MQSPSNLSTLGSQPFQSKFSSRSTIHFSLLLSVQPNCQPRRHTVGSIYDEETRKRKQEGGVNKRRKEGRREDGLSSQCLRFFIYFFFRRKGKRTGGRDLAHTRLNKTQKARRSLFSTGMWRRLFFHIHAH